MSFFRLSPPHAALGKGRLVYGFWIMNETIAYTLLLLLYLYYIFCLGIVVGVPTPLLLFDPM
jgi:hypothetical protein